MNARRLAGLALILGSLAATGPARADEPMIGHMVYFKLKDPSEPNRRKVVEACKRYLSDHPGTTFFAAGPRGEQFDREVNATDWDVALHLVFENQAAHDRYQTAEKHLKFIEENKDLWAGVRVYDSLIEKPAGK